MTLGGIAENDNNKKNIQINPERVKGMESEEVGGDV